MKCKSCGNKIDKSMVFCGKCGAPVVRNESKALPIFLSILLTVSLLLSVTFSMIHYVFSDKNLTALVDSLELSEIVLPIGENGEEVSLLSFMYDDFMNDYSMDNVTEKNVKKFLSKQVVNDVIDAEIKIFKAYLFDGKYGNGIPISVIVSVLEKNDSKLIQAFESSGLVNQSLPSYESSGLENVYSFKLDYDKISETIEEEIGRNISLVNILNIDEGLVSCIKLLLSKAFLVSLWIISFLLIVLLAVANRHKLLSLLLCVGIPAMAISVIYFGGAIVVDLLVTSKTVYQIIQAARLVWILIVTADILAAIGILLVIVHWIVQKIVLDIRQNHTKNRSASR